MELIDKITVCHQGAERSILLYVGDLTALPASEAVDLLVVSAFPDDYAATRGSLIGALDRTGVSVAELAKNKAVDLRAFSSCWLSQPVTLPGVNFDRILCFEPAYRGRAPEVVGDIFRSLVPIVTGPPPVASIAMPLIASGDQGEPPEEMLTSLVYAAFHWLSAGLPLERIKIVLRDSGSTASLGKIFAAAKQQYETAASMPQPTDYQFDVFISYCHKNSAEANALNSALVAHRPSVRVFLDRHELNVGAAWQQHIFESLDSSRKVVCMFSPDYIASKVCKEEFNIALMRHRETHSGVLLPVYVRSAQLPGYMRMLQYEDAREADTTRIAEFAKRLAARL